MVIKSSLLIDRIYHHRGDTLLAVPEQLFPETFKDGDEEDIPDASGTHATG